MAAPWKAWRARVRRRTQAAIDRLREPFDEGPKPREANLLALSDLHLGHELKRGLKPRKAAALDRQLTTLLDHYRGAPEDGLPWRLILDGDIVDFIGISLTPEPGEPVPFEVTPAERLYGLAPEPAKAVWKLEKVAALHDATFRALARFVAAGNELVVVRGNHDLEWSLAPVQEAFVQELLDRAFPPLAVAPLETRILREIERDEMRARITFRNWFYLEHGRVYVEHGHAYDGYSVSDDALEAPEGESTRPISEPVSTLVLRYFGNKHTSLDISEIERWGFFEFLKWGIQGGRFFWVFLDYLLMCFRVLSFSAKASVRTMARSVATLVRAGWGVAVKDEKLARIRKALRSVRADQEELAEELLSVLSPPAEQSVLQTAQMLYVDRLALMGAVAMSAAGCAVASGPPSMRAAGFLGVVLLALFANVLLGRTRYVDSHPKLLRAAHRVAVLFRVPIVIMGHSHRTTAEEVGDGSRYFNLGTWMGSSVDPHTGAVGYPHVVVRGRTGELRRWRTAVEKLPTEVA